MKKNETRPHIQTNEGNEKLYLHGIFFPFQNDMI